MVVPGAPGQSVPFPPLPARLWQGLVDRAATRSGVPARVRVERHSSAGIALP